MWRKRRTLKLAIVVILVVFLLVILLPFADPDRERVTHFLPENMKAVPHDPVLRGRMAHTDGPVDVVKKRFEHRRALLDRACRLYRDSSLFKPRVTTKEDLTTLPLYPPVMNVTIRYCGIAKSASTTWEGFFAAIKNHMKSRDINPSEDRNQAEDEVYFTFVREPYARLWSAYVDKLLTPNVLFWRSTGRYIVGKFRKNPSEKSRRCGHDVTFPEFIRYVIDAQRTGRHRDGHFIPTHDQCSMCHLPYRYIGHLETLGEDMPYVTRVIQSPIVYNRSYDTDTIQQNARMVFIKSRRELVQLCMDLGEASRRLWRKYQIRGLISKRESFPFTDQGGQKAVNVTLESFLQAALAAQRRSEKDPAGRKAQRTESLREAFAEVSVEDRLQLQQTLFLDFEMFGFKPYPEEVFPRKPYVRDKGFSYLSIH